MGYRALATDYDGTLATAGHVDAPTLAALARLRASGRAVLLVTGRQIADLLSVFRYPEAFDLIVAENGAVLYDPKTGRETLLAEPLPARFQDAVRHVRPLSLGRVVVATLESEAPKVLDAIHAAGLELQMIFNKGSLMVLPPSVNKATGLAAALKILAISPEQVVGVGDAENDHAFLRHCGLGVAVANALPSLKEQAGMVTQADHGAGVVEVIEKLLEEDR
ncbi:MAG: Cof-type HAD-IIB family hydrolase [Acidobacteriia bacterium]|nr:Cof-type HAD-IIB family hydrolase [Terriglobia bacterium]